MGVFAQRECGRPVELTIAHFFVSKYFRFAIRLDGVYII
jgi:hypothetical protein